MKRETIAEYIARGGEITRVPPSSVHQPSFRLGFVFGTRVIDCERRPLPPPHGLRN